MSSYSDVFGDQTVHPAGQTYRLIALTGHLDLFWPANYEGEDYIADINNVTGSAANWHIALPDATGVSVGRDFIMRNVGLYAFQVNNYRDVPVATLQPGEVKYFYLTDNATSDGTWNVFTFGTGTSAADASQLQGSGLTVVGSKLAAAHPVYSLAADVTATTDDRAKIFAFTGGSNTLTLPSVSDLGDNWFCGVRNAGSGSITIAITGVDRIDDQSSKTLTPGESLFVFCTGATYYTVGYGRSTQFQFTKLVKDVSAGGSFTLTSGEAANKLLQFTGAPVSNVTIVVPAVVSVYYAQNAYTGTATLTVKTASGSGATLTDNNEKAILFCDGVNVVSATTSGGGGGGSIGTASDGTASAPSFSFTADTDLGFYRIAADTLGLAAGGVEVARWGTTSSSVVGNFGVGTTSPQGKLDVRGLGIFSGGSALSGTLPTGTQLQLGSADGNETRQMIDSYGASTGPYLTFRQSRGTASAPTATLQAQNLGQITWRGRGATTWSTDRAYIIGRASENWTDASQGTLMLFATTPNGSTVPDVNMVLDQNGWLCIGSDSNPIATLDVIGDARIYGDMTAHAVAFSKADVPCLMDNTTGQGGLVHAQQNTSTAGYWGAKVGEPFIVWNAAGNLQRFTVNDDASGVEAYGYVTVSDERLKTNWEELPLDFVESLADVLSGEYTLTEDGNRYVGVGAQSLSAVMPNAVHKNNDGFLSVSYGNAALVACIELAKRVLALEAQVSSLRNL